MAEREHEQAEEVQKSGRWLHDAMEKCRSSAVNTPPTGTIRITLPTETMRHILQEWWNDNVSFPPSQVVSLQFDSQGPSGSHGYVFPESIVMVLLPIDPILQGKREERQTP